MAWLLELRKRVAPFWLLPIAMVVYAAFEDVVSFAGKVVDFCQRWVTFTRRLWSRLFDLAPESGPFFVSDPSFAAINNTFRDVLTLWVAGSLALVIVPWATRDTSPLATTTTQAVKSVTKWPDALARIVSFVLIALSAALILASYFTTFSVLRTSQVVNVNPSTRDWLLGDGLWLTVGVAIACVVGIAVAFFMLAPQLERAEYTPAELRDVARFSVVLWLISGLLALSAGLVPYDGLTLGPLHLAKVDVLLMSVVALVGLVAWRSALPFVEVAILVVVMFTINAVWTLISGDLMTAMPAPGGK
jgi:hypothetical protein